MTVTNFRKKLPAYLDWLIPTDVELVRVGDRADGGYLVPTVALKKADSLLSMGLGENWTFDEEWHSIRPQDPIHMYDGTVVKASLPSPAWQWPDRDLVTSYEQFFNCTPGVRHYVEMIGNGPRDTNLVRCIERLGTKNIFLKMDIEGGEYTLIDDILANKDSIIGMATEMHGINKNRAQFETETKKLLTEYDIVHIHSNIGVPPIGVEGLLDAVEITFLRKDLVKTKKKRYDIYLPGLDFVNHLGLFDIEYYFDPKELE